MQISKIDQSIGNNLKTIRDLRSETQRQTAAFLGVSISTYGRIERGELPITQERLVRLQRRWRVDISEFFQGLEESPEMLANTMERMALRKDSIDRISDLDDLNLLRTISQILDLADAKKRR